MDYQPEWMKEVSKPVLDFVSILEAENLYTEVPDEILINLQKPVTESENRLGRFPK